MRAMKKFLYAPVFVLMLCVGTSANAQEMTANEALNFLEADEISATTTRWFLMGIESGLRWAYAEASIGHGVEIFCPPSNLALVPEQVLHMIRRTVDREPQLGDFSVGGVLLSAMMETFPCE